MITSTCQCVIDPHVNIFHMNRFYNVFNFVGHRFRKYLPEIALEKLQIMSRLQHLIQLVCVFCGHIVQSNFIEFNLPVQGY